MPTRKELARRKTSPSLVVMTCDINGDEAKRWSRGEVGYATAAYFE